MLFNSSANIYDLTELVLKGFVVRKTNITEQYNYTQYLDARAKDSTLLYIIRADGTLKFFTTKMELIANPGDLVVSLTPPTHILEPNNNKTSPPKG